MNKKKKHKIKIKMIFVKCLRYKKNIKNKNYKKRLKEKKKKEENLKKYFFMIEF